MAAPKVEVFLFDMEFKYQLSTKEYKTKPTKGQWTLMKWEEKETDIETLVSFLGRGYNYRANLDSLSNNGKKNLVSSQIIMLDVEKKTDEPPELEHFLENTKIKPNFAYETFSSTDGRRYRLGYMIDRPITKIPLFKAVTKTIIEGTGVLTEGMVDPKSYDPRQNFCGTDKNVVLCHHAMLPKKQLLEMASRFIEKDTEKKTDEKPVITPTYEEYDLMCDFLAFEGTFESWTRDNPIDLPFVLESPYDDEDDTYIYYNDYITLVRKLSNGSYYRLCDDGKYRPNTFHDGEHRRNKIIMNCSLIHSIYPECTTKELLVLVCKMFLVLFTNDKEDTIDRKFIWKTVFNEMHEPKKVKSPYKIKKRFKKRLYDEGKPMHWKKQSRIHYMELALSLYDFSISIEDNLSLINNLLSKTKDDYRYTLSVLSNYLDSNNLFYFSLEDKPIKTLKRMISTNQPKNECLSFLLNNKGSIGKNQFTKYKRILE